MKPNFSGYVTKYGLKCSDGRTILAHAFKEFDGQQLPLVWQHTHDTPSNVLGHVKLEHRDDGVYGYGYFNEGSSGQEARGLVEHGDVQSLSIYANQLKQRGRNVIHGSLKEVSLVLAGANPGALIDNVNIAHGDGDYQTLDDEAIIYTGMTLEHGDEDDPMPKEDQDLQHEDKTVKQVFDAMSEEQRNVVYFMLGEALEGDKKDVKHSDLDEDEDDSLSHDSMEGGPMSRNVFEHGGTEDEGQTLSHSQVQTILTDAKRVGSLKESVMAHAANYGIQNIDILFPDAKAVMDRPEFVKRRTEWVAGIINGVKTTPFSRIKSLSADITHEEARALGYIKGNLKKEEFFAVAKRETTPKTIYKKQKLDRDDIVDITDFDVVAWLKAEMRVMLEEEVARAILIGDGRDPGSEDKISELNIRPIATDDDFYSHKVSVPANVTGKALINAVLRARKHYKGKGRPAFYTTEDVITDLLLLEDKVGRRYYETEQSLASALRVSSIIAVEVLESTPDVLGIMVNIGDYTVGTDKGGQTTFFDDFDIDYNQYKYLLETRMSGALTLPKTAIVFNRDEGIEVFPQAPTADGNDVTIPSVTGVTYYDNDDNELTGVVTVTTPGPLNVRAEADDGYYLPLNVTTSWAFPFTE